MLCGFAELSIGRYLEMRKIVIAILALAIAIAFSPINDLQAAGVVGPGSKVETEAVAQVVKAKKKWAFKRRAGKKGKRAKCKRAGSCGTYMYYSKKARKCVDARNKK
mgnify:CR=1 FL=1